MPADHDSLPLPVIVAARDALLRDAAGREYTDLNAGYGAVWLGHNHPAVTRAIVEQLERYAAPGYLPTESLALARAAFAPYLPQSHFVGGLYSTGMEAMEAALRAAAAHTGARDVAGFRGSTHGRSLLTAAIGADGAALPSVHNLPSFAVPPEVAAHGLRNLAREVGLAAIVVEPVQMTGGGYALPRPLGAALFETAREHGIPVLFDETLTGFHRCGMRYFFDDMGEVPDLIVVGKGMANGFPAAAVVLRKGFAWDRARVKPGSTFWNHPLACAATAATLSALSRLDAPARVGQIEATVQRTLGALELRGRGAMWCLGCPSVEATAQLARRLLAAGVIVSYYDRYLRLLPPLTIATDVLAQACDTIRQAHAAAFG